MPDGLKFNIEISAPAGEAQEAFAKVAEVVKQLADQIARQMGKAKESFDITKMLNRFRPWAQALGNVKNKLDETVGAALSWSKEVNGLSRTLGISTVEAGGLAKALGKLGSDTGSYTGAVFDLQRSLDAQEAAFNANGIATRKANGEMLGIQKVMMNTLKRVKEMKPGYDANALAMLAFGQSAQDLGGLMKQTNEAIDGGTARVKALGIEVDSSGTTVAKNYQSAMNDVRERPRFWRCIRALNSIQQSTGISRPFPPVLTLPDNKKKKGDHHNPRDIFNGLARRGLARGQVFCFFLGLGLLSFLAVVADNHPTCYQNAQSQNTPFHDKPLMSDCSAGSSKGSRE